MNHFQLYIFGYGIQNQDRNVIKNNINFNQYYNQNQLVLLQIEKESRNLRWKSKFVQYYVDVIIITREVTCVTPV